MGSDYTKDKEYLNSLKDNECSFYHGWSHGSIGSELGFDNRNIVLITKSIYMWAWPIRPKSAPVWICNKSYKRNVISILFHTLLGDIRDKRVECLVSFRNTQQPSLVFNAAAYISMYPTESRMINFMKAIKIMWRALKSHSGIFLGYMRVFEVNLILSPQHQSSELRTNVNGGDEKE